MRKTSIINSRIWKVSLLLVCSLILFSLVWSPETFSQGQRNPFEDKHVVYKKEEKKITFATGFFGSEIPLDNASSVGGFVNIIIKIFFAFAGTALVLMIAFHGFKMIFSQFKGSVSDAGEARKKLGDAFLGIGILLFSWMFLNFVNPDLLNPTFLDAEPQGSVSDVLVSEGVVFIDENGQRKLIIGDLPIIREGSSIAEKADTFGAKKYYKYVEISSGPKGVGDPETVFAPTTKTVSDSAVTSYVFYPYVEIGESADKIRTYSGLLKIIKPAVCRTVTYHTLSDTNLDFPRSDIFCFNTHDNPCWSNPGSVAHRQNQGQPENQEYQYTCFSYPNQPYQRVALARKNGIRYVSEEVLVRNHRPTFRGSHIKHTFEYFPTLASAPTTGTFWVPKDVYTRCLSTRRAGGAGTVGLRTPSRLYLPSCFGDDDSPRSAEVYSEKLYELKTVFFKKGG